MIVPYGFMNKKTESGFSPNYDSFDIIFSFKKLVSVWTHAIIKLQRSSDSQERWVFFDGSGEVSLSSFIGETNTSPTTTTLGTWVGSDNARITHWYNQNSSDMIISTDFLLQSTYSSMPNFITSGVIDTKGGEPTASFNGSTKIRRNFGAGFSVMDSGNDFTVFTVSHSDSTADPQNIMSTNDSTGGDRLSINNDRRTAKRCVIIRKSSLNYFADYSAQIDSANQRLVTVEVDGASNEVTNYYNNSVQTTDASWTGSYGNTDFVLGVLEGTSTWALNGSIQEILVKQNLSLSEISDYNDDINSRYSIY